MSRSNPNDTVQNPATRWINWSGSKGVLTFYNKEKKEDVEIGDKFSFLLLDTLASIRGWHEASESGIYSNEVRDTRSERLLVKAFKGGTLAEGFYSDIKDKIVAAGGGYNSNLYIAYREAGEFKLGALVLKGAALSAWMEFSKANKKALNEGAIQINGSEDGKKGSVKFKTPKFFALTANEETNAAAIKLDQEILQPYLKAYLAKKKAEQVDVEPEPEDPETKARKAQNAEWEAAQEEDRRQRAGGDTKLRELANRPKMEEDDDIPW